jgi:hypothetical protein
VALAEPGAERNLPDPDKRAEQSREQHGDSTHLQRLAGGSVVKIRSEVRDDSGVEPSQDETQSASKSEAQRTNGTNSTGTRMIRLKLDMEFPFFKRKAAQRMAHETEPLKTRGFEFARIYLAGGG